MIIPAIRKDNIEKVLRAIRIQLASFKKEAVTRQELIDAGIIRVVNGKVVKK